MTKFGAHLEVLLDAMTRNNKQGNIIVVVGNGKDITRHLVQEREYTCLIGTANVPIFGVNTLGQVNVWNKCTSCLIGYSSNEVMEPSLVQEFITNNYQANVLSEIPQQKNDEGDDEMVLSLVATQRKEEQKVEHMAAEKRSCDKEAAWMKEQQEGERVKVGPRACDEEATEFETCQVEGRSDLWLALIAVLAYFSFKDVINSNSLFFPYLLLVVT
jgi:hypothetical protein